MIDNNKIRSATNRDQTNYEINRVVVESYISMRLNNVKNQDNNLKNAQNNKNNNVNSKNIENNNNSKKIVSYSPSPQEKITLISRIKSFNLPLSINGTSLNYIVKTEIKQEKENNIGNILPKQNYSITKTSVSIKAVEKKIENIQTSKIYSSYNNVIHKEVVCLKNVKENQAENVEINLNVNENQKDNIVDAMKMIIKRWKEKEKEFKMRLTYISNNFVIKKKYVDELVNKLNININKSYSSAQKNQQEYYLLIKQDHQSNNNQFIHEIISPTSAKELENNINTFIANSQDNSSDFNRETYNKRTSQNNVYVSSNTLKKSRHNNEENNTNVNNNTNINKDIKSENFSPVFIFNYKQLKDLLESFEGKMKTKKDEPKYLVSKNISFNYLKSEKREIEKEKEKENEKIVLKAGKKKKIEDSNFNIYPVKLAQFEFIHHSKPKEESEFYRMVTNTSVPLERQETKETEDFSQCTPISLLQEKYFLYAVSKWAKYSIVNPQDNFFIKYYYKSGHPKFDPILLDITNFCLWIEKIKSVKDVNKKSVSSSSFINNSKNNSNKSKGGNNSKGKIYKSGAAIFMNDQKNYNEGNSKLNKKKSKEK